MLSKVRIIPQQPGAPGDGADARGDLHKSVLDKPTFNQADDKKSRCPMLSQVRPSDL